MPHKYVGVSSRAARNARRKENVRTSVGRSERLGWAHLTSSSFRRRLYTIVSVFERVVGLVDRRSLLLFIMHMETIILMGMVHQHGPAVCPRNNSKRS